MAYDSQIRLDYHKPLLIDGKPMLECCCDPCYWPVIEDLWPPNNYTQYGTTATHPFWCYVDYRFCDWVKLDVYAGSGCTGFLGGDWIFTTYSSATNWLTITARETVAPFNPIQFPSGTTIYWKVTAYNNCGGEHRFTFGPCRKWTYIGDTGNDCNNCVPKLPNNVTVIFSNMTGSFTLFQNKSPVVCSYTSYCHWEKVGGDLGYFYVGLPPTIPVGRRVEVDVDANGIWRVYVLHSYSPTGLFSCFCRWRHGNPGCPCTSPPLITIPYSADLQWCSGTTTTQANITVAV